MTKEMQEYLAKTAQADKERNRRILAQCRENLIKHNVFAKTAVRSQAKAPKAK